MEKYTKEAEQINEAVIEYDRGTLDGKLKSGCIMHMLRDGYTEATIEEIESNYPFIAEFINKIKLWNANNTQVACFKDNNGLLRLFLYSHTYEYVITVGSCYINAGYSCRKVEPLEDWNRGGDLTSGDASKETMEHIAYAILHKEMLSVFKPKLKEE
jgi:hypothetical protein